MPLNVLRDFLRLEAAGGILLVVAAVLALAVSNSPLHAAYAALLDVPLVVAMAIPISAPGGQDSPLRRVEHAPVGRTRLRRVALRAEAGRPPGSQGELRPYITIGNAEAKAISHRLDGGFG